MLINGIDISTFGAKHQRHDIQTAEVITYQDWLRNSPDFMVTGQQETYKAITCDLIVKGINDDDILLKIGNIVGQAKQCIIKFDDSEYYYKSSIVSKNSARLDSTHTVYSLHMELQSGYAYKSDITEVLNKVASKTISVEGNLPSPAIITITMPIDTIDLTLTGFGDPVTIKNIKANVPVIVNGEAITVTQAGLNKFAETDIWLFPILKPGSNVIVVSNTNGIINITYKPKFR